MVNVTHNGDHGCTRLIRPRVQCQRFLQLFFNRMFTDGGIAVTQLFDYQDGRILIENLVDGRHYIQLHQLLDHLAGLD